MPNILVNIPKGAFAGPARADLARRISDAAAMAERMPDDPHKRFAIWVVVEEAEAGLWTCGGVDMASQVLPCIATVHVPAGVLDAPARALYVRLMHDAFQQAQPADDRRRLATSVRLHDVADGTWGVNGDVWQLPRFAKVAGYGHLQHLADAA